MNKFETAIDMAKMILLSQPGAVEIATNYPRVPDLRVNSTSWLEDGDELVIDVGYDQPGYQGRSASIVVVDCLSNPKIAGHQPDFFHPPHWGSAGIGVALFGLPTVILTLPFIALHNSVVSGLERTWKMSYRYRKIFNRVGDQLDNLQEITLETALQNLTHGIVGTRKRFSQKDPFDEF